MNTMDLVRFEERAQARRSNRQQRSPLFHAALIGPARLTILKARQFLLNEQLADGSWRLSSRSGAAPMMRTLDVVLALRESGVPVNHPSIVAAARWIAGRSRDLAECNVVELAQVLMLLSDEDPSAEVVRSALPPNLELRRARGINRSAADRGSRLHRRVQKFKGSLLRQIMRRQRCDGGWGEPEVTGVVLQAVCSANALAAKRSIEVAIANLRVSQRGDGSWRDADGYKCASATSAAVRGLAAAGVTSCDETIAAGLNWLAEQRAVDRVRATEPTWTTNLADCDEIYTSSAAMLLLAHVAVAGASHDAALDAVESLINDQCKEGDWIDASETPSQDRSPTWHELSSVTLPLRALSAWAVSSTIAQSASPDRPKLRLVMVSADN